MKPLIKTTTLLFALSICISSVSHAQHWRLVASSKYLGSNSNNLSILDSIVYSYNANSSRGSTYNNDQVFYDSAYRYSPDNLNGGFDVYGIMAKRYDAVDHEVAYRLFLKRSDSAPFTVHQLDSAHYNTDGTLAFEIFYDGSTTLEPKRRVVYTYNAQSVLTEKIVELPKTTSVSNDPNPFKQSLKHIYRYGTNGLLALDSIIEYNMQQQWEPYAVERYSYNTFGQLIAKERIDSLSTSTPFTTTRAYYGYNNSKLTYDSTVNYSPYNGAANPEVHYIRYNSLGLVEVDTIFTGLNIANRQRSIDVYSYTTFNFVDNIKTSSSSLSFASQTNYYYGPYSFPTSTSGLNKQRVLTAYPVPSSNFINLNWETEKPTTIKAKMVNLQGQVVKQWSDKADGTYTQSIYVGNLPTGNYYIVLDDGNGSIVRKQVSIQR